MSKIISIVGKCSDMCSIEYSDEKTKLYHNGYVPRNIGIGGGDYIRLKIDIETGQIIDWPTLSKKDVITSLRDK